MSDKPKAPRIYSRDFNYVNSSKTDISKTFARIRREQKERAQAKSSVLKLPTRSKNAT